MPAQLLFDSGSSDLRPESLAPLREISKLVRGMPHPVAIEGHTDSVPVASGRFESNWDLSAARAVSTLRFLVDVGGIEASRLRATGFADSRPLVSNDTGERRALNRRVEIVFLKAPQEVAAAGAGRSGEAVESGGVSE
jgi:chemotaxis protein MotB